MEESGPAFMLLEQRIATSFIVIMNIGFGEQHKGNRRSLLAVVLGQRSAQYKGLFVHCHECDRRVKKDFHCASTFCQMTIFGGIAPSSDLAFNCIGRRRKVQVPPPPHGNE